MFTNSIFFGTAALTTLIISHASFLDHITPLGHPERPDRLRAINRILSNEKFDKALREDAPIGSEEAVVKAHSPAHFEKLKKATPAEGTVRIDADTTMSPGTWEAAMRGVGGACRAVDAVMLGECSNSFLASRPPGHHAEKEQAMGFCFFNNAAIAAIHAQDIHGAERVAIVDFDVHHGNGTQDIFWDDPTVLYCSTHQMPLYPGSGSAQETGVANNIVNVPLASGSNGDDLKDAFNDVLVPRLNSFSPDLIVVSAGFDAHIRDPLGGLNFTDGDFAWATQTLLEVADKNCDGKLVSVLEGGYDLEGLARSTAAHVLTLMSA